MNKIFIDAGFYVGHALDYYAPLMDKDWLVYAFEPNPNLEVERSAARFPFEVQFIKKAVWTEDGEMEFALGGRDDASHIKELRATTDKTIKVPCIDFSKFVKELPDTTIICSMDIEGAEFPVLEKMLKDDTAKKLNVLDIEFHHRLLDKPADDASRLRIALEHEGVLVKLKLEM